MNQSKNHEGHHARQQVILSRTIHTVNRYCTIETLQSAWFMHTCSALHTQAFVHIASLTWTTRAHHESRACFSPPVCEQPCLATVLAIAPLSGHCVGERAAIWRVAQLTLLARCPRKPTRRAKAPSPCPAIANLSARYFAVAASRVSSKSFCSLWVRQYVANALPFVSLFKKCANISDRAFALNIPRGAW